MTLRHYNLKAMCRRVRPGDHVVSARTMGPFPYEHHGIYVGSGVVVHFRKHEGITWTSLKEFGKGEDIWIMSHRNDRKYDHIEVADRALESLDVDLPHEYRYRLVRWNCEHFANWCVTGVLYSDQAGRMTRNAIADPLSLGRSR